MKEFEQTISLSEAKKLLQIKDRSLYKFIKSSGIKIITTASSGLAEVLLDKADFLEALKLKQLPEKFLTIQEAATALRLTESKVLTLCKKGDLPFYRLTDNKGGKLLFIEAEICGTNDLLPIEKSDGFYVKSWKYDLYENLFIAAISTLRKAHISELQLGILFDVLIEDKSLERISKERSLTIASVKRFLTKGAELSVMKTVYSLIEKAERLEKENKRILAEQARLRQEVRKLNENSTEKIQMSDDFSVQMIDLGLSVRAMNCLKVVDLNTLGELLNFRAQDLMKIRGFGGKTLNEIQDNLAERGLHLRND